MANHTRQRAAGFLLEINHERVPTGTGTYIVLRHPNWRRPVLWRLEGPLLNIRLVPGSAPAAQIRLQLTQMIREGELVEGAELPSIRALAKELGVAPGTVARVYKELEEAELIESRPRLGSRVRGAKDADNHVAKNAQVFVQHAKGAGLSLERAQEVVSQLWES